MIQPNLLPLSAPIRFGKDVNVSKIWKLAENLIDFGGKGYKVVSLNNNGQLVALPDPKQKLSTFLIASTILKVGLLALTYMSIIGGIIHLAVIVQNRKKYTAINATNLKSTALHLESLTGKELNTKKKIRAQFTKDYNRDLTLAINGQILEKPDQKNAKDYKFSDFPKLSEVGLTEDMFTKIGIFSQQGSKADGIDFINGNFQNAFPGYAAVTKQDLIKTVADITKKGNDVILKLTFPLITYDKNKFEGIEGIKKITAHTLFTKEINLSNENEPVLLYLTKYESV